VSAIYCFREPRVEARTQEAARKAGVDIRHFDVYHELEPFFQNTLAEQFAKSSAKKQANKTRQ